MSGHRDFISQSSFCDLKVHEALALALPNNIQLQIANSASIRYAQLFPANATHEIFCNRGTSGIEGSTSTAMGAAVANPKPTVLITGDLSFFYDINALWQNHTPNNFRIILINNQGGGIFRILPKAKSIKPFETYLETPHQRNAVLMAKEFGFNYLSAHDQSSLTEALDAFFSTQDAGPQILEIFTPKQDNDLILNQYFDHLDQMATPHLVTDKSNQ
jgi:2-succinyl-5-enolpyruvyl-6-hydroxy-3-cyclohexene-1-carboxylate synthase